VRRGAAPSLLEQAGLMASVLGLHWNLWARAVRVDRGMAGPMIDDGSFTCGFSAGAANFGDDIAPGRGANYSSALGCCTARWRTCGPSASKPDAG